MINHCCFHSYIPRRISGDCHQTIKGDKTQLKRIKYNGGQSHTFIIIKNETKYLLKIPLKADLSREQRFRFKQEAEALKMIKGLGAPKVFDFNFEDDEPFIVMELINGKTLGDFINGVPLELDVAFELLNKLTSKLAYFHELGLQHRDIKPDNIIIHDDGEVSFIDFGLCRIEGIDNGFKTPADKELGNRFLRLPELGKGEKITSSVSDVTFLVGIFFFVLTAKQPHLLLDENNLPPHRKYQYLKVIEDNKWLNQVFDKGFAYSIAQRYQTCEQLIDFITVKKQKRIIEDAKPSIHFDELLNSLAFQKLDEILQFLIEAQNTFLAGVEEAVGENVRTNGVNPQIDETGYGVDCNMFILPKFRQQPRIWWRNKSVVSQDLTTITHECDFVEVENRIRIYSVAEKERISAEYFELGKLRGKELLSELYNILKMD